MECDEEWAMNKKVVDLSSKNIRQAVSCAFSKDIFESDVKGHHSVTLWDYAFFIEDMVLSVFLKT